MTRYYDQVTLLNAPLAEGWGGQQVRNWDEAVAKPEVPATVQPTGTTEDEEGRDTTVTRWRILCGPDEPLDWASRVRWAGAAREGDPLGTLEVEGDVGLHKRMGRPHHLEAILKRVVDA